ncbi:MAG: hypothetical protein H7Y88_13360 [Phycisphaerales bacterium]|nr:hypothetical protein [Phycisphaerales bacterium]
MKYSVQTNNIASSRTVALARLGAIGALALGLAAGTAGAQDFNDGGFNPGDWATGEVMDTTFQGLATFTVELLPAGGVPGANREVNHTLLGSGALIVGHMRNGAVYDPATQGAIESVTTAYDIMLTSFTPGPGTNYGLVVRQNNVNYLQTSPNLAINFTWTHFETSLVFTNFTRIGNAGPVRPDFSASGAPIQFGYYSSNSSTGGWVIRDSAIDNWSVTVDTGNTCSADIDGNGTVASADITAFLSNWFADLANGTRAADFNADQIVSSADITAFLNAWFVQVNGC